MAGSKTKFGVTPIEKLHSKVAPAPDNLPRLYPLPVPHEELIDAAMMIPEDALRDPFGLGAEAFELAAALPITEGEHSGKLFGDVALEWQRRLIVAIYGHRDKDKRRIIRRVFLRTARKSGKSSLVAIFAILEALLDDEGRAQIACIASSRDQSRIVFGHAAAIIRAEPSLKRRFKIADYLHRATDTSPGGAEIKAYASESGNALVGLNPSAFICDELHAIGAMLGERGLDLVHAVESGMLARPNALSIFITTAPVKLRAGIYAEVAGHAEAIFAGEVDDRRTLVLDYSIPESLDYDDPENWFYANPSMPATITQAALEERYAVAKARGPAALAEFQAQNLNVEPKRRDDSSAEGFDLAKWDACEDTDLCDIQTILDRSKYIVAGVDAGGARDLTSLVLIGIPHGVDDPLMITCHAWVTHEGYARLANVTPAADFVARGELTLIDKVGDDVDAVIEILCDLRNQDYLAAVGVDPWGLEQLAEEMSSQWIRVEGVPQGVRIRPFLIAFERDLGAYAIRQSGNTLLRWCLSNARFKEVGRGLQLTKIDERPDSVAKIDAAIALICAHAVRGNEPIDTSHWVM